jgi:hypothetical protein
MARQERFEEALSRTEPDRAGDVGDELLRLLHRGLLQHYAGQYEESNAMLQRAEEISDERFTRSISRAVLSLVTSDRALAYVPNHTERLMINYYGALNYLALGDPGEAAVEARRLSGLLERTDETEVGPAEAGVRRALRYFAGTVFEAAGEQNDAAVAYRHVWPTPGAAEAATARLRPAFLSADRRPADQIAGAGSGEVVVVLESGLVAHRVERSLNLPLFPGEADGLDDSDADRRLAVAACIASRALGDRWDWTSLADDGVAPWNVASDGRCLAPGGRPRSPWTRLNRRNRDRNGGGEDRADDNDGELYVLRVAWPEMAQTGGFASSAVVAARLQTGGDSVPGERADSVAGTPLRVPSGLSADLSGSVVSEFQDKLGPILIKSVARAAAKYRIVKAVGDELGDEDEVAGDIARVVANAAAVVFERADTRSWHLLPAGVTLARLQLPPGTHALSFEVAGDYRGSRVVDLGEVEVRDGGVQVVSARVWP